MDVEKAVDVLKLANLRENFFVNGIEYVGGSKEGLPVREHLKLSFDRQPSKSVVKNISDHFVSCLNSMDSGHEFSGVDASQSLGDFEVVQYYIKDIVNSRLPDLGLNWFRVSRNTNLSLGPDVSIYIDSLGSSMEDSRTLLKAYHAYLETNLEGKKSK